MLRPLVRLLIRSGVTFPILTDLLRTVYLDVATHDLAPGDRTRTDSRIALLTGIHRKELRRQREAGAVTEPVVVTLNSQLIARWLGDPAYAGRPIPRAGPAPSFDALVASVTRDLRSRAVLEEWLAQGLAELDAQNRVVLHAPAFLPRKDSEARLFFFARNLHDHVAAAAANVAAGTSPPFLERSVHYDRLSRDAAAALECAARQAAGTVLLDVNRAALAIADADDAAAGETPRRHRVNFGVYVYIADGTEDGPDAA